MSRVPDWPSAAISIMAVTLTTAIFAGLPAPAADHTSMLGGAHLADPTAFSAPKTESPRHYRTSVLQTQRPEPRIASERRLLFPDGDFQSPVKIEVEGPPRRIVTDAGAGGYQAFPDVCRLKNGDLLCVFYAGYSHISHPNAKLPRGGRVCAVRSSDEGQSWSEPITVVDTPDDDRDPSVCCLPDGTLLCNLFVYGLFGECDTCIVRSRDGGKSWSAHEIVAPSFATSSPIRRLRSGRLLLSVYTVDGGGKRSYPAVCISEDGGRIWSSPHPIGQKSGKTLDETDIFERKDGTLLAVMREVMCAAVSRDGGKTWGDVRDLGFPGHCPYLLQTRNGVLLMGHRVPETSLHYSLDEGRTWRGPLLIDHKIGAYPSLVSLRDGRVLCVYYEEGANSAIRAITLRVDRLLEKH